MEKCWTEYIKELYDDPQREEAEPIEVKEGKRLTVEEVRNALKKMGLRQSTTRETKSG